MEEITKLFNNPKFGILEVVLIDGKEHFPATDVAKMLGYANPHDAISKHCRTDGVAFREGVSETVNQHGTVTFQRVQKKYITEGNLYRLITHSKLPAAEKFESWVFDEVIPDIRRTGSYGMTDVSSSKEIANIVAAAATETIAKVIPGMIAETIKQIMPLIGADKREQNDETITEEVTIKKYKRRRTPGKIERMPEGIRRTVDGMLYGTATFDEIRMFLKRNGCDVSRSAVFRYKNNLFGGKIKRQA